MNNQVTHQGRTTGRFQPRIELQVALQKVIEDHEHHLFGVWKSHKRAQITNSTLRKKKLKMSKQTLNKCNTPGFKNVKS